SEHKKVGGLRGNPNESGGNRSEPQRRGLSGSDFAGPEQHINTARQLRAVVGRSRSEGVGHAAAEFDNAGKARGVGARGSGGGDHEIIAGDFAFEVYLAGGPAEHGMESEDSFEDALEQEGVVVATGEVGGFVEDDFVEVSRGEFVQQVSRDED